MTMKSSENLNELFNGMYQLKSKITQPTLDGSVDYKDRKGNRIKFDYATLKNVEETIRKAAQDSKSGIDFQQTIAVEDGYLIIKTLVTHTSGQWIEHEPLKFQVADNIQPQSLASLTTYGRRYTLQSVFGVVGDEDDDGKIAADQQKQNNSLTSGELHTLNNLIKSFSEGMGRPYQDGVNAIKKAFKTDKELSQFNKEEYGQALHLIKSWQEQANKQNQVEWGKQNG